MNEITGFLPRVSRRNRRGVSCALRPPTLDDPEGLQLGWTVLDAPTGLSDASIAPDLQAAGANLIIDTGGWRFRDPRTFVSPKWSGLTYTPSGPFELTPKWIDAYVAADLRTQAELGAAAFVVPGWFRQPGEPASETHRAAGLALDAADRVVGLEVPVRPLIAYVPIRSGEAAAIGREQVTRLSGAYSAVYVQWSKVAPYHEPPDRLAQLAELLLAARADGRSVIAGHLGAIYPTLRALGIDAADAGLGEGEAFDLATQLRPPSPHVVGTPRTGAPGPRLYLPEIDRSVAGKQWRALLEIDTIRAELACRRACCRWRPIELTQERAVDHSLRCRLDDADATDRLPASMRLDHAYRRMERVEARLNVINGALRSVGAQPVPVTHVTAQKALLTQGQAGFGVA